MSLSRWERARELVLARGAREKYADALRSVHTEQCRAISEHAIYVHIQDVLQVAHFLSTTDENNNQQF